MKPDIHTIERLLDQSLAKRMEDNNVQKGNPTQKTEKLASYYQHRIWQLKDRLSCKVFGPDSESMTDNFLHNHNINIQRHSKEYYVIMRMVLTNEIKFFSYLKERLSGFKN
jgi:hypothetical protein